MCIIVATRWFPGIWVIILLVEITYELVVIIPVGGSINLKNYKNLVNEVFTICGKVYYHSFPCEKNKADILSWWFCEFREVKRLILPRTKRTGINCEIKHLPYLLQRGIKFSQYHNLYTHYRKIFSHRIAETANLNSQPSNELSNCSVLR